MTQEGNTDSLTTEKQQGARWKQATGNSKSGQCRQSMGSSILNQSRQESHMDSNHETRKIVEQRVKAHMPTKIEMADMIAKLEHSLKTDMATLHGDMGQILSRKTWKEGWTIIH